MHQLRPDDVVVGRIAIGLQNPFPLAQKLARTLSFGLFFFSARLAVIQSRHGDVVLAAVLPPRPVAFGKTIDDAADFLLVSHSTIFGSIARPIKMGSSGLCCNFRGLTT